MYENMTTIISTDTRLAEARNFDLALNSLTFLLHPPSDFPAYLIKLRQCLT